jgi:hypothetical protein
MGRNRRFGGERRSLGQLVKRASKARQGHETRLAEFFSRPPELDIRGLGRKVCQALGVRSGDVVEFHILGDGSLRIVNNGSK